MSRQLPLYKIEWTQGTWTRTAYVDNGLHLDIKVRELLSRGLLVQITVETKPSEIDLSPDGEIERSAGRTS